jgi:hypothetical protein
MPDKEMYLRKLIHHLHLTQRFYKSYPQFSLSMDQLGKFIPLPAVSILFYYKLFSFLITKDKPNCTTISFFQADMSVKTTFTWYLKNLSQHTASPLSKETTHMTKDCVIAFQRESSLTFARVHDIQLKQETISICFIFLN